jgi:hypothetical protein
MKHLHFLMLILAAYTVHYSIQGEGHDITVMADTPNDARLTVQHMFPDALVTGVRKNP